MLISSIAMLNLTVRNISCIWPHGINLLLSKVHVTSYLIDLFKG